MLLHWFAPRANSDTNVRQQSFISCYCFKQTAFNYFSFVVFVLFVCNGGVEGDISSDIEERFSVLEKQKAVMDKLLRAVSDVPIDMN